MADVFANQANLLLTALFFHPLLPVSIPIALVATIFSYWTNKVSSFFPNIFLSICSWGEWSVPTSFPRCWPCSSWTYSHGWPLFGHWACPYFTVRFSM